MKVLPISFSFKSQNVIKNNKQDKENYPFLYTANNGTNVDKNRFSIFKISTLTLAIIAVCVTLVNIIGNKKYPKNIVEIEDKTKGLNKIKHSSKTIQEIKDKILYPLIVSLKRKKDPAKNPKLKSGLILTNSDNNKLSEITEALIEQSKELGLKTITINHVKLNNKNKNNNRLRINKRKLNKQIRNAINTAKGNYKKTGEYTIINIGNINDLTNFKIIKSQKSNFEALLADLNSKTYPGVIWVGWTDKTKSVPLFFNDLPVLITKLID